MSLHWKVDECAAYFDRLRLRGWCFVAAPRIVRVDAVFPDPPTAVQLVSFGQESGDVAAAVDPAATHCRFDEWVSAPPDALGRDFSLRFTLADGTTLTGESVLTNALHDDPFHLCWEHFVEKLNALPAGEVLEIGSRSRTGLNRRDRIPRQLGYVGLDILPGPNVDVVGDAHQLERQFGRGRFAAAFSLSVFEHLAMPWKAVLELNRVLKPGGLIFTLTHQTWPLHEEPWDFWRFSQHSWKPLFNAATGFEILEAVSGEPARIHPCRTAPVSRLLHESPAYLGSASIVRKISETELAWPVSLEVATSQMYPSGELAPPPR